MLTSIVFTAVLASSSVLLAHADVAPNEPGLGEVFNQGAKCHVGWAGDTKSATAWKNMAIELMTGSNEKLIHLTTVATEQDGTVNGTFDYNCPEVTPNSHIYFYQFTSGGTSVVVWTTRFTIAGADGSTTPPTQTEKASDGTTVEFGNGALVDPSTAVGPPTFNTTTTITSGSSGTNSSSPLASPFNSASSTSASASNTSPPSTTFKKKNLAGPIAGGVLGGLVLVSALGFLIYRARRRQSVFAGSPKDTADEKHAALWPSHPLSRNVTAEPQSVITTLPSGKTQLSLANQGVPPALLASQAKQVHPEESARQEEVPPQARDLTKDAEGQALPLPESSPTSASSSQPPDPTNAQLVAEIRLLREQMNVMQQQQQQQMSAPPQYTPGHSGASW